MNDRILAGRTALLWRAVNGDAFQWGENGNRSQNLSLYHGSHLNRLDCVFTVYMSSHIIETLFSRQNLHTCVLTRKKSLERI